MYFLYLVLLGSSIVINSILLVNFYLRTQKNSSTISLFILLLLVNIWFIPKFLTNALHPSAFLFETFSRIAALGYIFVPVVLLVFCISYSSYNNVFRKFNFWLLLLIPPVIILYLSWTSNLIGVHNFQAAKLYPWGYETPTGKFWPQYLIWYDFLITLSVGILVYHYRSMIDQSKKRQTLLIIIAVIIPLIINTISVGLLPIYKIFIFPIGLILLDIFTIIGISLIYSYGLFEVSPLIILSNINQIILTVDIKGRIIHLNPFAEKIFKVNVSQISGTRLDKLLMVRHKDKMDSNECMRLLKSVFLRGKSMTFNTFSVLTKSSQKLPGTISISPIYSQSAIIGANIFLVDIKKEKSTEKPEDDYFSMLFHEIKTPITSIKAYNQLLIKKLKNSNNENSAFALKVDNQLNKLSRLVNDSFELARLHGGKITLKKGLFDVNELVHGVIDNSKIAHKDRAFTLKGYVNNLVYADKDKIEQVIINFINNAIKFSPPDKEIVIHIASDAKKVTIGVQDYGKGIDPKFHKKVFDRFFQIGIISKEKKGLGIGLFIASTIVKAHKGRIWVTSKLGKGSTFYFSLPLNKI